MLPLPVSANMVTAASMVAGLAAAWAFAGVGRGPAILGALLFLLAYVLDNCDGEVARRKGQTSDFGRRFDSFVDWIIHFAFFLALGWGAWQGGRHVIWFGFGVLAALGGTINYGIDVWRDSRDARLGVANLVTDGPDETARDRAVYLSRLLRNDFCFVVFALSPFDVVWVLLPLSAVGAQVYWGMQCVKGFRRHHV